MSRGNRKSDSKRYYDWIYHAALDRMAAERLSGEAKLYYTAAFHCQQCIEKALKGYLLFKSRKLLDGHNLTWLCKQAAMMDSSFTQWIDESAVLNRYYIETRYPADIPLEINRETMDSLMKMSGEMMDFICSITKFDFGSYHKKGRKRQNSEDKA
ncbi:MAG: HEPN domain-containing protein [Oscillospiraceae bacterium]|nr:HEPN domain-containing protein [Oscillospiraceae bacterium]